MALAFIRLLSGGDHDYVCGANIVRRYQTIERVVNGTFSMQKEWMLSRGMPWNEEEVGASLPVLCDCRVKIFATVLLSVSIFSRSCPTIVRSSLSEC